MKTLPCLVPGKPAIPEPALPCAGEVQCKIEAIHEGVSPIIVEPSPLSEDYARPSEEVNLTNVEAHNEEDAQQDSEAQEDVEETYGNGNNATI
jgi:hypothetical protein